MDSDLRSTDEIVPDREALLTQLRAAEAQALRTVTDLRQLYEQERRHRRELETAHAQQLRLLEDFKAAHQAEQMRRQELEAVYLQTMQALAQLVELKDEYTGGHIERVRTYSLAVARALRLDEPTCRAVEMGAVLHDVGKVSVPDAVLSKPGPLTGPEWAQMRTHPEVGVRVLGGVTFLSPALAAVVAHHERWDGGGYPGGLRGDAIPLLGRVVAVADAFDAMTTDRPYRPARPVERALAEVERGRGAQFDPDVAQAFLRAWQDGTVTRRWSSVGNAARRDRSECR